MKFTKSIIFILMVSFIFSCKKKDDDTTTTTGGGGGTPAGITLVKKNKALFIDFSETWCPPCGSYGGPSFDQALVTLDTLVSCMKVYGSSTPPSFNSSVSNAMAGDYAVSGVPTFFVNGVEEFSGGGVQSSISANVNWVKSRGTVEYNKPVIAAVGLSRTITDTNVVVKTKVQFYTASRWQKYQLAVYLLEDKLIANQSTTTGPRASATASYKGDPLNNSVAIVADQLYEKTYTITKPAAWVKGNIRVMAVIYDATAAGKPTVINTWIVN
ncbi:MAG: Omp28-related outer membrane protein [Bacteroidetes bacterium]|nr:Omp28-related outer membrane protein [Bacteroidota bacterium]